MISTGAATLLAGALSSAGQLYANQQNLKNTNAWNDVQVDLANTAHQREVLDLKAAGLNPVLSAGGSGAAVPQLGSADISNPGEGLSHGIASAAKIQALEVPKVESQVQLNASSAKELETRAERQQLENEFLSKTMGDRVAREKWLAEHPGYVGKSESEGMSFAGNGVHSAKSEKSFVDNEYSPAALERKASAEQARKLDFLRRKNEYDALPSWKKFFTPVPKY